MMFKTTVYIECETLEQAEQVAGERLGYDEDLGFDYTLQNGAVTHG